MILRFLYCFLPLQPRKTGRSGGKTQAGYSVLFKLRFCGQALDDILKKGEKKLRSRGPQPKLSDSEVITMEIVGESLGFDCDKSIHRYFRDHWQYLFPRLGDRTTFLRQAASLWKIKQEIRSVLVKELLPDGSQISIVDGFPMPVCNFRRAHFAKAFKGSASYGYCAAKAMTYYGLKGHLLIDVNGVIVDCSVAPANVDEREMLLESKRPVSYIFFFCFCGLWYPVD